jgi:aspartate/methionine/tyrosine aminotransferase
LNGSFKIKSHLSKRGDVSSLAQVYSTRADELRAEGKKVICMHLGQPFSSAPKIAIDAVVEAIQTKTLGYTSSIGITPLRERIAQHYQDEYNTKINPDRIIVTIGASGALLLSLIACFDAGAKFGIPYPVYPAYVKTMQMLNIEIVPIQTTLENHFQVTANNIANTDSKLDGLIIASPGNPTGSVIPPEELKKIIAYCKDKKIQLISDEIYHGLVYPGAPSVKTTASLSDDVIIINSFSKYYSMPGWRIGWMVVPERLLDSVASEARNLYLAPASPSQYAALAAMDSSEELDLHLVRYAKNRKIMMDKLKKAGFDRFTAPDGAFYMYVRIEHLHHDSKQFCMDLLNATYITSMPGTSFDPHQGHHYIRFAYSGSTDEISEALDRIIEWRKNV